MKICPRCQKTYTDDGLNFCLDDGATLSLSRDNSIPATVMFNQPRPTNPSQPFGSQPGAPNAWSNPNQTSIQPPRKKSKTWLLVLGILSGVVLICGGGLVGFVYWAANLEKDKDYNANYNYNFNVKSPTPADRTATKEIDLSKWVDIDESGIGVTSYQDGEFTMSSKEKRYYYVLVSSNKYQTEDATTRVTVRNVDEAKTSLGFGLIVHSNPKPLIQDYAFLIDSENKKYRIVRHVPQDEITVVNWTSSPAIKNGTLGNLLEVRDQNKRMSFYINNQLMTTVNNTDGYAGGVPGLYSSNAIPIAFSKFEVSK